MIESESNLKKVNEMIVSVIDKYSMNGMTKEEIASTGLSVLRPVIWRSKSKIVIRLISGIFFTILLSFCVKNIEPLNRLTAMYGRIVLFEVCSPAITRFHC